jgi:integrase
MPSATKDPKALVKTKHPGIYARGNGYVVRWKENGRGRKQFCGTIAEALQVQGQRRDPSNRSVVNRELFRDYALDWLANYTGRTARGLGELTREDYERIMRGHLIPWFGNMKLGTVQAPDVRAFITSLERKGLSPGRIRKIKAPLSAMFATAVEDGTLRVNPAANVRVVGRDDGTDEEGEIRALTDDELATFLGVVNPDWRFFFVVLYRTGLRISEALGLTWADVEFGASPCVHVHQQVCRGKRRGLKSKASRRVLPLSKETAKTLWKMRAQAQPDAPVFATGRGTPYSASNVANRVLIPARDKAGLPWVTFHTFRHTCASVLYEQNRDDLRVSKWLGHESVAFTRKTYIHLRDTDLGSADFFDAPPAPTPARSGGHQGATEAPQTAANVHALHPARSAS